jgi:hypothetical protein
MAVGRDIQVFISASRALLQSVKQRALTEEEQRQLQCCLEELVKMLPPHSENADAQGRHAA